MIITIDGPSGTGKSVTAKRLALRLGCDYFDTGALYRAVAWKILKSRVSPGDTARVEEVVRSFSFSTRTLGPDGLERAYYVDDQDVTEEIRSMEVTAVISKVAAMACVREALIPLQRNVADEGSVIFEGRDLGTVIFPHADVKFFLTADVETRAGRRLVDLSERFPERTDLSYEAVLKSITERDRSDSTRSLAPLTQPADAIVVDTTSSDVEEVVDILEKYVRKTV
ncbi:MAG: (d)CMP kinase [Simkaniaceae bacterium]|nr:(d)CMP kinase [Simkaniaceae bacterium]